MYWGQSDPKSNSNYKFLKILFILVLLLYLFILIDVLVLVLVGYSKPRCGEVTTLKLGGQQIIRISQIHTELCESLLAWVLRFNYI